MQKEGTPKKYDFPKGVINLKKVNYLDVKIDHDNATLLIPVPGMHDDNVALQNDDAMLTFRFRKDL